MSPKFSLQLGLAFLTASLALTAIGCDSGPKRKETFPASGKVTLPDGKPAEHATVVFHPIGDSDPNAIRPQGKVGPDGTYKLTTYEAGDGAPAGDYKVTVELWLAGRSADEPPSNRLPVKYAKADTSGFSDTVKAAPTELKPIELKR